MNKMVQLIGLVFCLLFLHVGLNCEQITIGTGNLTERIPVDMHSMNSLYQCIYLQSEMGISSGTISKITLYDNFTTPMYYKPIKVWLGTSEQTSLTENGWIPSSQLTMVYDGTVNFYYGQNSIVLDLPMGYYYPGGSLVLMVQRPMDTTSYGLENKFYCQSSSFNRSLRISSDSTVLSPLVPPTTGATLSGLFPKTTFNYATSGFAVVNTGIQQSMDGSHSWADSNGDGLLDLLATGSGGAEIYINNGNGGFVPLNAGFTGVSQSAADWGDYDNDGDLDVAISGNAGGTLISKIYRNNGNNSYIDIGAGLTGLYEGSVNWADYDNDGDLDLLLTGNPLPTGYAGLSILYRNDGNVIFTDAQINLPGVSRSDASWGDMDNDGDLDLLMAGHPNASSYLTKVFRNDEYGSLTDTGADLIQVNDASVQWGDQDGDGDLDILYTGQYETPGVIEYGLLVYNNNGSCVFTEASTGLIGTNHSYARWGDYDNDGDLDIFYDRHSYSELYRNNGNSTYEVAYTLQPAGENCSAWGD
ncbi:MAG: VCBS repeat-containing protein, partial [Candidatus Cloacimonetes bacterium]|nr:VCBS repeat-containing protein [Candidatus Cloacimonadota bacterium]